MLTSVRDADVAGKRVLVRAVLNVPLQDGMVTDDARVRALVPTLELLRQKGATQITVMGYLGRPGGKVVEELRVAPVRKKLSELTDMSGVEVLENLRFDPREEANDSAFAAELAAHGDVYVNDAFADSHRTYASIVGAPKLLPHYMGLHLEQEIQRLAQALTPPQGAIAIIGGAKFETKQPLLEKLLGRYSTVLLGGVLGNDVLKARGLPVGASLVSPVPVPTSLATDQRLVVATDAVVRNRDSNAERDALVVDMQATESLIDIGPATAVAWAAKIAAAPFVLWNGPMGVYEMGYTRGTDALAEAIAQGTCTAVVGGGDTLAALKKYSFDPARVFASTGGGAMLEYLVDGTLPGLEALRD